MKLRNDKNVLLLVNPNAGGGKAKRLLEVILFAFIQCANLHTRARIHTHTHTRARARAINSIIPSVITHPLHTYMMQRVVKPMLSKAKMQYDTMLTHRQGHAGDICEGLGRRIRAGTCKYQVTL